MFFFKDRFLFPSVKTVNITEDTDMKHMTAGASGVKTSLMIFHLV